MSKYERIKYGEKEWDVIAHTELNDYSVTREIRLCLKEVPKPPSLEQVFTHLAKGNDVQFNDCVYRMMGDELHYCLKPTGAWSATTEPVFLTPFYLKHCRLI